MGENLGRRIRQLRQARHWSQQELSMRAGISTPHISSIERCKRQPSLEYAKRMADALGVPLHALCDDEQEMQVPKMKTSTEEWPIAMQNFILNESAAPYLEAAQKLSTLPTEDAKFLSMMIELLVQKRSFRPLNLVNQTS